MFALKIQGSEMRADLPHKPIVGHEGQWHWVCDEPEKWVEATSAPVCEDLIPGDIKKFRTEKSAERFAKRWKGHPWWVKPNGNFEIIKIKPVFKKIHSGFKRCD